MAIRATLLMKWLSNNICMSIGYFVQLRETAFQKMLIQRGLLCRKISGGWFIGCNMPHFTVFPERKWIKPILFIHFFLIFNTKV